MKKYGTLLGTVLIFLTASIVSAERVIYVAPEGNDVFSGSTAALNAEKTDGPIRSLAEAVRRVEKFRAENAAFSEPVVVELADGVYELAETLALTPKVSGTAVSPTVFRAAPNARPVISGGRTIQGFTVGEDGFWRVTLDDVKSGDWYFQQLFVNNQRRFRPRMPKTSDYQIAERIESPTPVGRQTGDNKFRFTGDEIQSSWKNLGDVEVFAYHNWTLSRQRVAAVDDAEKIVTVKGCSPSTSNWGIYAKGHRFYVENVFESLNEPGEFYLDRTTGELTYLPREGETPESVTVTAPRLEYLMTIAGSQERLVENIRFEGLVFAFSNWTTPEMGNSAMQAEVSIDAAIPLAGARFVDFQNCGFRNFGNYALAFGTACKDCSVTGCAMKDLGAGGIRIGGDLYRTGSWPYEKILDESLFNLPKEEQIVERVRIADSLFEYLGRLHPAAIGVWIGHAANNTIERCDIFDLYYSAVSVGWVWGYGESVANHNIVRGNHLHKIGQKLLSDMGAVYTLGISPGTKITENLIHDVDSFDYGGWGLYTDEGSTGIEMSRNIVYNTKTGSFHQHYGQDNRIEYNILANSRLDQLQRTRMEDHNSFFFEHNVVYWENDSPLLGSNWKDDQFQMDNNVYWNPKQRENIKFLEMSFDQWQAEKKKDLHSVIADPCFANPAQGDFSFPTDSPAAKIGVPQPGSYGPKVRPTILDDIPAPGAGFVLPE